MLDWLAVYATEINSLHSQDGENIELVASDDDNMIVVTRKGKTLEESLRKCVAAAMKQLPASDGDEAFVVCASCGRDPESAQCECNQEDIA